MKAISPVIVDINNPEQSFNDILDGVAQTCKNTSNLVLGENYEFKNLGRFFLM
jgi:hypothetical protein